MATSIVRSSLRAAGALRSAPSNGGARIFNKKGFSSSASHDDAYETAKWEKITYAGIVGCTIFAAYNLSKGHPHHDDPPAYPYLHIRNKEFPWAQWWESFGGDVPNLRLMAIKILNLTGSSSGCERNWSTFEGVLMACLK